MFDLVVFDGISNLVSYLMPNPINAYILDIYDLRTNLDVTFWNKPEVSILYTIKLIKVSLSNAVNSICY